MQIHKQKNQNQYQSISFLVYKFLYENFYHLQSMVDGHHMEVMDHAAKHVEVDQKHEQDLVQTLNHNTGVLTASAKLQNPEPAEQHHAQVSNSTC